jgi:hypothetical protein
VLRSEECRACAAARDGRGDAANADGGRRRPHSGHPFAVNALPEDARLVLDRPFTGDFDEMVKRRMIRFGVTFNRTLFHRRGHERGLTAE